MDRRIRTVLYGDQPMEAAEFELLHTPALQRLYELHQLGLTDRVFVDASHSRFQHVIGVLQQVDKIISAIASNLERRKEGGLEYRDRDGQTNQFSPKDLANYVRKRRRAARLMGLLHDLTHAPFGHTLEDEIALQVEKHDDPARQADAFFRLLCQCIGWWAIDLGIDLGPQPPRGQAPATPEERLAAFLDAPAVLNPAPEDPAELKRFIDHLASLTTQQFDEGKGDTPVGRGATRAELVQMFRDLRFAMRALVWLDALHKGELDDLLPGGSHGPVVGTQADAASRNDAAAKAGKPGILPDGEYPFEQLIDAVLIAMEESPPTGDQLFHLQRDAFLLDVIGNTICADLLDYARRDSHYAGLKLDYDVDRIVENFTLVSHRYEHGAARRSDDVDLGVLDPFLRTAISIFSHKLRVDVPGELMNLLQVRFYVYQRVLFHPTKCVAGAMLGSAVQLAGWSQLPLEYRFIGDDVFLHSIREALRLLRDLLLQFAPSGSEIRPERVAEVAPQVRERLQAHHGTLTAIAVEELLKARDEHRIDAVVSDFRASLRLLDRLSARRYHKPVFRLLPSVTIPGFGSNAKEVANYFLNPQRRAAAEREIERRAGLPPGTITMHCPRGDGPKKIAEILLHSEKHEGQAVRLRDIGELNSKVFAKHEEAIKAVEEMYASMWRLVVSVSPPYHLEWETLTKRISRVLYAHLKRQSYEGVYRDATEEELDRRTVAGGDLPHVPNDRNMEDELRWAAKTTSSTEPEIRIVFPDGTERTVSPQFMELADVAVSALVEASPKIRGHQSERRWAAAENREQTLRHAVEEVVKPLQMETIAAPESKLDGRPRRRGAEGALSPAPELGLGTSPVDEESAGRRSTKPKRS